MKTRFKSAVLMMAPALILVASPAFAEQETIRGAVQQPLRDLSIVRDKTPEALLTAAKGAYDNVDPNDCDAMRNEIIALDKALGPDLDDVDIGGKDGSLVTDAVKSAVRLPFAGVVRRMSGAQKRQQEYDRAVIAGVARRGYLKGAISACAAPEPAAPPPVIIRTEAPPPAPPVIDKPAPRIQTADAPPVIAGPEGRAPVQIADIQQPGPRGAPHGTLEAQAQDAISTAPAGAIQRKTVTVSAP